MICNITNTMLLIFIIKSVHVVKKTYTPYITYTTNLFTAFNPVKYLSNTYHYIVSLGVQIVSEEKSYTIFALHMHEQMCFLFAVLL